MPRLSISFISVKRITSIILFFISIGLPTTSYSQAFPSFTINHFRSTYALNAYAQIFKDSLGLFNINQTSAPNFQKNFRPLPQHFPQKPHSTYWLKITLINNLSRDTEWILHTGNISKAALYIQDNTKKPAQWQKQLSGKYIPMSQKQITESRYAQFPVLLPKNIAQTFFISITNTDSRIPKVIINLQSNKHWYHTVAHRNLWQGIFHGFLWLLATYFIFIYFVMKDKVYAYYSVYIVCVSVYFLASQSFLVESIFQETPKLNEFAWYIALQLAMIAYFYLLRSFLLTKVFVPWWDALLAKWTLIRLIILPIGLIILLVSFNIDRINWLVLVGVSIDMLLTFAVLAQLYKHHVKFLGFFVTGIVCFMIGSIITIYLFIQDTNSPGTIHFIQLGIGLQLLSYAIGLGIRFRYNERQKQHHQKILIAELQTHQEISRQINTNLEKTVEERTKEVATKNTRLEAQNKVLITQKNRLEALNSIKAKLFSIISHDLRSPINSIQGVLHLMNSDALSNKEIQSLSISLTNQIQITQNLLDNLLYWSKLQMQGISVNYTKVNLFQLVENTFHLFTASNNKKLTLENTVQEDAYAWADANMVALIVRNLVANAVKFTPYSGTISVKAYSQNTDYLKVSVNDTGVGIAAENIAKIFDNESHFSTPGTAQEKGTGLGLMLCQEFVEKNNGKIWVESTLGEGSQFIFTLPKRPLLTDN